MLSKEKLKILLKKYGMLYSKELGIDLKSGKEKEIFKWFIASVLFGKRINETIAKNTFRALMKYKLDSPKKILSAGWYFLVRHVMREGGYVRYDGMTSQYLLDICEKLIREYKGKVTNIEKASSSPDDLERRLLEFRGVGPVTVNIFLRELRGIWKNAKPELCERVIEGAKKLGVKDPIAYWKRNKIRGYDFRNFEAMLLRVGKRKFDKEKIKSLDP